MNTIDNLRVTGRLRITARDQHGRIVDKRDIPNLVVTTGRNLIRDYLAGSAPAVPSHMAVGTGTTAAAAGDTTLGTEIDRKAITQTTTAAAEVSFLMFLASTEANGNDLTEAGVFTAASGGTMLARTTYAAITKTSLVSITYDWTLSIGAS